MIDVEMNDFAIESSAQIEQRKIDDAANQRILAKFEPTTDGDRRQHHQDDAHQRLERIRRQIAGRVELAKSVKVLLGIEPIEIAVKARDAHGQGAQGLVALSRSRRRSLEVRLFQKRILFGFYVADYFFEFQNFFVCAGCQAAPVHEDFEHGLDARKREAPEQRSEKRANERKAQAAAIGPCIFQST